MKKLSFLVALLSASMFAFAADSENYALKTNGSSATASSVTGDNVAENAIDGNDGTRWESASTDDETWNLDLGQSRTFNMIRINWEGAFCSEFEITYSADGENWTSFYKETALASAGWQTIYQETSVTGRYIKYHGTKRATQWSQSFFEFQVMQGDAPKENIAKGKKIIASSTGQNEPERVLDGNGASEWQGCPSGTTDDDEASRTYDAWFVVDLEAYYDIEKVAINFEGACSQDFHIDFAADTSVWKLGYDYKGNAGVNGRTETITNLQNNTKVRFVRFWSTKSATQWGMKIFEFEVYGSAWVPADDNEKPVMVSAELVSKSWNNAIIAVSATDNQEVAAFHVVDAAQQLDKTIMPTSGNITLGDLTASTAYKLTITAIDVAQNESENSKIVEFTTDERHIVPTTAAPTPTWPAKQVKSIYSDAYTFAPASLNSYNEGWWENPTMTEETIGEDHFLHYDLYKNGMIGAQFAATSVATMEKTHIDIYASAAGTVTFRWITSGDPDAVNNTRKTLTLEADKWNSFDIDLTDFGEHNWANLFQFSIENYQAGGLVGEHISVDNIYLYRTTELSDNEKPTNVTGSQTSATYFSAELTLSAEDNSGSVSFVVKNGEAIVATGGGASGAAVKVSVTGLRPNTEYNFSVIAQDEAGNKADAINVSAKTADGAPSAAPTPNFTGKEAVAVFCDVLENNPAIVIGNWSQTTVAQVVELADNDEAFYGSNFNYLGWELAPAINAADMEYVHVDFYAKDVASVQLTPISPGHEGVYTVNLKSGEWTSVDVPLSVYEGKGIEWNNIFQFKFMEASPSGRDLFIDNVYFFKSAAGVDNTATVAPATKFIEDGSLYILRDGVVYTIQGAVVR